MNQKRKVREKKRLDYQSQSELFVIASLSNREKKVYKKKKSIVSFFLVSLQLEIDTKSEKLTFQFEILQISNCHFFCVFRVF